MSPGSALLLPLLFTALMMTGARYAPVHQSPRLLWSFLGTGAVLLAWNGLLLVSALRQRHRFTLEIVVRKQHYVQACAHASILLYWGWYWRTVYDSAFLIVAQILFAYAFDLLLTWSRRDTATLGFGPFPIVFSTNLFLWFRPDWFYFQFVMIALAFVGKEFIRWNRDGRTTHVFNPSAFTLTVFSLALIVTGTSDITWGQDIAITQFYPPHMYVFLFLVSLPGQILFGVTTMTMAAVLTTYLFGLCYYALTGTYYFFDSYVPIAVFLGMHLLFTDPSTAPRTDLGRMIFGVLYGISTIALYGLLGMAGLPPFYDKLLQVPLLNLSVKSIDRVVRSEALRRFDPARIGRSLSAIRRNLAYMSIWAIVFGIMSAAQGVGDRHRGQWIPFWQQACQHESVRACRYLAQLHATYCRAGSGWSCNELAILLGDKEGDRASRASPPFEELPILLRGSKGPITDRSPSSLYSRACDQGWPDSCQRIAGADTSHRISVPAGIQ